MGWTARVKFPEKARYFSIPQSPVRFWDPPSLLYNGYGSKAAGVSSAKVKNGEAIFPLPHMS
jgi:hypothetical protein